MKLSYIFVFWDWGGNLWYFFPACSLECLVRKIQENLPLSKFCVMWIHVLV